MNGSTKIFLSLIFIFVTALFSYGITFSYFSNSAVSTSNTFTAAVTFPTSSPTSSPTPSPDPVSAGDIVINEVYSDGANNEDWVELYNNSASAIDVTGWKITDNTSTDVIPTSTSIPAGGFAVIVANSTTVTGIPGSAITITLSDNQIGNGLSKTGDRLQITTSSDLVIDQMDYGDDSTFFTGPLAPGATQTVIRTPNGVDTDTGADWIRTSSMTKGTINP